MVKSTKRSQRWLLSLMGLGVATTIAACGTADRNTVSEAPNAPVDSQVPLTPTDPNATTTSPGTTAPTAGQAPGSGVIQADQYRDEDVTEVISSEPTFSTLARALDAADLGDALNQPGPYTVFAPTDQAFASLPAGTLDKLLLPENREALREILGYHLVQNAVTSDQITPGDVTTLQGTPVTISKEGAAVKVGNAQVTQPDIIAENGVIHAIDQVLIPPGLNLN